MKYDIFISYSRYDTTIVDEFVTALEDECFSVWIDRDGIESGDAFKRLILTAIKESQIVLFFSSKHSNQSEWTAKEIGVAVKYKKHIIPIKLDNSNFNEDVEFDLINLDFVDYSVVATREGMKERLLKTLRNKLGKGKTESKAQEESENMGVVNDKTERRESLACPEGVLPGVFSVSPTKKVFFSKGNLQYQTTTGIWRFADRQYDMLVGNDNYINDDKGWIDLFGWGTGNSPTKKTTLNLGYLHFVDWGTNIISNGGKQSNLWRTLTKEEWNYLLEERDTLSGCRWAFARVNNTIGLVLFPDLWNEDYNKIINPNRNNFNYKYDYRNNLISADQWEVLEPEGLVFLPAAGFRHGTIRPCTGKAGDVGVYWSSTKANSTLFSFALSFSVFTTKSHFAPVVPNVTQNRSERCSVRLVCSAE